jgi:hypothetical protein
VRQKDFKATLVEGPGGNFLSNEVSYRAQRLLRDSGSAKDPWSFHVHTPSADAIAAGADAKKATAKAMAQRGSLIDTLKRVIGAVARLILDRRAAAP